MHVGPETALEEVTNRGRVTADNDVDNGTVELPMRQALAGNDAQEDEPVNLHNQTSGPELN